MSTRPAGVGHAPGDPAVRAGLVAILDQFLFVGASSLMVLLLGRGLEAAEYGAFVLAYSTFLLLAQAQTAVLAEPMSVFAPSRFRDHAGGYLRAVERLNLRASLLSSAAFLAAAGANALLGQPGAASAFLGAAFAAPPLLSLWLRRRSLYVRAHIGRSLGASATFLALGVGALFVLHRLGRLDALTAMTALGVAALGGLLASGSFPGADEGAPRDLARAHWGYGRWALLIALLGWSGNLYYFLLPMKHGLESAAELRALFNFVYPVIQANQALTLLLLPRWAAHESRAGFAGGLGRLAGAWAVGSLALCAGAALAGPWVVHVMYAGRYDTVAHLLPWACLLVLPDGLAYLVGNGLRASRAPERVALGAIALPVAVLFPGLPLMWRWGTGGAIAAMLVASLAQLALVWRGWRRPEPGVSQS